MTTESLSALLVASLLLGVGGAPHCAGMCGGIASSFSFAIPEPLRQGRKLWVWQGLFSAGRVTTYTAMGAVAGALSHQLLSRLPAPNMAIGLGLSAIFMLLLAAHFAGKQAGLHLVEAAGKRLWQRIQPATRGLMPVDQPLKAYLLGVLWGWLPCGLIYSALALAATSGTAISGALIMAVFGIVTVFPVATTGVIASRLTQFRKGMWPQISVAIALIMALLFAYFAWQASVHPHQHGAHTTPSSTLNTSPTHPTHHH